ncbi:hypothetical protein H0H92_009018 [Tricholoma furcatifolium]|nr:hypothetical protein H0H92_009018 [Tricholoma furcatifolium]
MPAKIRDGGLYKIRSAFSGEVITFVTTDPEGSTYIESDGYQEKFFTFKSMQKSAGMDYYIGCPVPDGEQPIIPKTTADKPDDWTLASEGGAMYR